MLVAAFQENSRKHPISTLKAIARALSCPDAIFALEAPDARGAVETEAIQREPKAQVGAAQGLFLVTLSTYAPAAQRIVIVGSSAEDAALHIHSRAETRMFAPEVVVVEERSSRNGVRGKMRAKHQAEVAIDSLGAPESIPQGKSVLHEKSRTSAVAMFSVPNGDDGIDIAAHVLAPHPGDARIQAKVFVKQQDSAMPDGILDCLDEHARTLVSKSLPSTLGIIDPRRFV